MNYHYPQSYDFFHNMWPFFAGLTSFFLFLVFLELILKAVALWKAARADQMAWFIALIIFNTVGILPIIYLLFFMRKTKSETALKSIVKTAQKNKKRATKR